MTATANTQFELLKKRYQTEHSITAQMLCNYVKVGRITEKEYKEITGLKYPNIK